MKPLFKACLISCSLFAPLAAGAQNLSFEGEIDLSARYFSNDGALEGQTEAGTSFIGATRLAASGSLSFGQVALELRGRKDQKTGVSSWDLSKAYLAGEIGSTQWLVGSDVVFWGVAESYNPVNIVNQRGSFISGDDADRRGQPMIALSFDTDTLGTFSFFGLLGFRELNYEEADQRLRFDVVPDGRRAMFETDSEIAFALRNTNTLSTQNGSLDYAVSLFSGRDRQPVYLPGCAFREDDVSSATCNRVNDKIRAAYEDLSGDVDDPIDEAFNALDPETQIFLLSGNSVGAVPYYQDIHQIGLELAYATGDWQLKFEGAQRFTDRETYFSGVVGAEYSFGNIFGTDGELRGAVEYIYDDRSQLQPQTFLDNEVFAALHYDFNNVSNTSLSISGLRDIDTDSTLTYINLSSRLTDNMSLDLSKTFINADDTDDPLSALDEDDFFEFSLKYFF